MEERRKEGRIRRSRVGGYGVTRCKKGLLPLLVSRFLPYSLSLSGAHLPFPNVSHSLSRSVLSRLSAARGPKNGASKKCEYPSVHLASLRSREEKVGTREHAPGQTIGAFEADGTEKREKRNNESRTRRRRREKSVREKRRGRMNARCLRGANKNSNRTFRSSSMLLLDLLSLRP